MIAENPKYRLRQPREEPVLEAVGNYVRLLSSPEYSRLPVPRLKELFPTLQESDSLERREAINEITTGFLRYVISFAKRFAKILPKSITLAELISEGNILLLNAIEDFDHSRGNLADYIQGRLNNGFKRFIHKETCAQRNEAPYSRKEHKTSRLPRRPIQAHAWVNVWGHRKFEDIRSNVSDPSNFQTPQEQADELLSFLPYSERELVFDKYGLEIGFKPLIRRHHTHYRTLTKRLKRSMKILRKKAAVC
ncbi:MAG: hypothetical protein KKE50_01070 [Nanoarchaeota archaeon]|nr:hypothetical protein [Nanoarchaeota archaeon]